MVSIPVKISNVGMTSDGFDKSPSSMRSIVHFDPTSYPDQLVPHRSSEDGDSSASTNKIGSFVYANSKLYGLSYETGSSQKLFTADGVTGATWSSPANMSISAAYLGQPIDYHGALYLTRAAQFDAYTYAAARLDTNISTLGIMFVAAVVHSKDDILYLASSTTVYKNSSAVAANPPTASTTGIIVPKNLSIVSLCEYGNYLAIGCAPASGYGKSIIFLWDRDSALTTLSESIDLGDRNLVHIEQIEGQIIAISFNSANSFGARITFQSYAGGQPQIFKELISTTTYTTGDLVSAVKQKVGQRLYFLLTLTLNGTKFQGVWRVSRPSPGQPFTVSMDYLPNNDTALTAGTLNGFFIEGDYAYISYISSSTYGMSKTDDQANYTATSYIETCINPRMSEGDNLEQKALKKFGVTLSPMSSGQQVVAKYRVDGGSWKTIFTKTFTTPTASTTDYTSNRDATGQFDQGVQYEFRIESTGGAILVAYSYDYTLTAQPQ